MVFGLVVTLSRPPDGVWEQTEYLGTSPCHVRSIRNVCGHFRALQPPHILAYVRRCSFTIVKSNSQIYTFIYPRIYAGSFCRIFEIVKNRIYAGSLFDVKFFAASGGSNDFFAHLMVAKMFMAPQFKLSDVLECQIAFLK